MRIVHGLEKLVQDPREWALLVGDRLVLAGVLEAVFGLAVFALVGFHVVQEVSVTPMLYLYSTLVGGNITLITIVLSINQLVLSRQLKTPGELSAQIENAFEYRFEVEEQSDRAAVPVMPSDFLAVLLSNARENAHCVASNAASNSEGPASEDIYQLTSRITSHTEHIEAVLDRSQGGIFSALAVALETNYSDQLNQAHRLEIVHGDDLCPETIDALGELRESLRQIDVARQYFKTIYMEDELARLSRILLYAAIPTVGSSILMLLLYAAPSWQVTVDPFWAEIVLVTTTLGFLPLALLFSFLLRVATVAKRTAAITPFTTPGQELEPPE